eukprot:15215915-Heterocapsa_arctica.AAC.1
MLQCGLAALASRLPPACADLGPCFLLEDSLAGYFLCPPPSFFIHLAALPFRLGPPGLLPV